MAVDVLRLIQVFAEKTGNRDLFSAPTEALKIESIPINEAKQNAHFIYDIALCKQVLRSSDIYLQDHFLDKLLLDCEQERVQWVKLFVEGGPEFLDGTSHSSVRKIFKANIDKFASIASSIDSNEIKSLILNELGKEDCSALSTAKEIIRLRFTQILEEVLSTKIVLEDTLLFDSDIFTPSARMMSIIYRINDSTDQFIKEYIPNKSWNDKACILPILSLFYMASTPLLGCLVSFLNSKINEESSCDLSFFTDFRMVPTNYVAREAARDAVLNGTPICKGDKLYLMLFESTGCPFSEETTIPFGHGKHLCPGAELSKLIMHQSIQAAETIAAEEWALLKPSLVQKGRASAFLAYEG